MSDDNEELKGLIEALASVGNVTATIIPIAVRMAQRMAKKMIPGECPAHQMCAAHRLVALTMMVNGMLILKRSTQEDNVEDLIAENIKFAKFLLAKGEGQDDDDEKKPDWMSDEQLRRMFEQGAAE